MKASRDAEKDFFAKKRKQKKLFYFSSCFVYKKSTFHEFFYFVPWQRIDFSLFSILFTCNKKFSDLEKILTKQKIKRFLCKCGREKTTTAKHCYVFIFSTWFFHWKTTTRKIEKSLSKVTESSKGTLIFI